MKKVIVILLGVCFLLCGQAQAADIQCSGTVTGLTYGTNGEVYIKTTYRTDWMRICSVEWEDGIGKVACAMWAKNLNDAYREGKRIVIKYVNTTYTCDMLPTWGATPVANYLRLEE